MQYYAEIADLLGIRASSPEAFADMVTRLGRGQGDDTSWTNADGAVTIRQSGWRLMRGIGGLHPSAFDAWNGLNEGLLASHNRRLRLQLTERVDGGSEYNEWIVK